MKSIHMRILVGLIVIILFVNVASGQNNCPQIVKQALITATNACINTERNFACYGNNRLEVQVKAGQEQNLTFKNQGDKAQLQQISSLQLSSYNEPNHEWGIAVMKLQANLPDTLPGQNVIFLLFGNVEVANVSTAMNAFYFKSGIGDAPCQEAPDSGILIQTPKGQGRVTVSINEVVISLGSTAFLQAQAGGTMSISMLQGQALVANQTVTAGSMVEIPISDTLTPSGAISEPRPYDFSVVDRLPIAYLDSLASGVTSQTSCTVSPKNNQVTLRVGPGTNRGPVALMPSGNFMVTGQIQLADNSIWFQLDKNEVLPKKAKQVNEIWVNSEDVTQNGDCSNVQQAAPPVIIQKAPEPTSTPAGPAQTPAVAPPTGNTQSPAVIEFWADQYDFVKRGCTTLHWHIENIQEAYLDGNPVAGPFGDKSVCVSQTTTYTLKVTLKNGQAEQRQVTINVK